MTGPGARPPQLPELPRIAGLPLELWAVIALFAAAGGYILIEFLPPFVDGFGELGNEGFPGYRRLVLLVMTLLFVFLVVGAGLLAVAYLLYRGSRVGRGFAYVVSVLLVITWIIGIEGYDGGDSARPAALVVVALLAIAAAAVLAFAPATREHFTGPDALAGDQPQSVVVSRVILGLIAVTYGLLGILALSLADIDGELAVYGVLFAAVAGAAAYSAYGLTQPNRALRAFVSIAAAAGIVVVLIQSRDNISGSGLFIALLAVVPIALWLPADARRYFGDQPLDISFPNANGATTGGAGGTGQRAHALPRRFPAPDLLRAGGYSPALGLKIDHALAPQASADEIVLATADAQVAAGWLGPTGNFTGESLAPDQVFAHGAAHLSLTTRRLSVALTEPHAATYPGDPHDEHVVLAIPLEAVRYGRHGSAILLGVRSRRDGGWLRLTSITGDDDSFWRHLIQATVSRTLQTNRSGTGRQRLESLAASEPGPIADFGGELHRWEPAVMTLLAPNDPVPAPAAQLRQPPAPAATHAPAGGTGYAPPPVTPPASTVVLPPPATPPPPAAPAPPAAAPANAYTPPPTAPPPVPSSMPPLPSPPPLSSDAAPTTPKSHAVDAGPGSPSAPLLTGPPQPAAHEAETLVGPPPISPSPQAAPPAFCTSCGTRIEGDDRFCVSCGNPVRRRAPDD